jgi:hypothetical protein
VQLPSLTWTRWRRGVGRQRALAAAADAFVIRARELGMSDDAAEAAFRHAVTRLGPA